MRRAKIIATLGPASFSESVLKGLMEAGVDVFRLNFSHGDESFFQQITATIRKLEEEMGTPIAILQDLQGPKIRTGPAPKEGIPIEKASRWTVTSGKTPSQPGQFSISYRELLKDAKPGQSILIDDGKLRFDIEDKSKTTLTVVAHTAGVLGGNKGVHFPNMQLTASSLTEKDFVDLNTGLKLGVDYIALSFVRRPQDLRYLRDFLNSRGSTCGIIAKIEREEALNHIDEIIEESDGIMVARGDMAVELGPENVPAIQKNLIRKCNQAAKPVITATEMLLSMVQQPTPTRAEASDVANAILDGTDAVMLSNETAVGQYPVEAVRMMDLIVRQTESLVATEGNPSRLKLTPSVNTQVSEAVVRAAFDIADSVKAKAILAISQSDLVPRLLSKYRPLVPLYCVVVDRKTSRKLKLVWGVRAVELENFPTPLDLFDRLVNEAVTRRMAKKGDYIVVTAGLPHLNESETNTVKVMRID